MLASPKDNKLKQQISDQRRQTRRLAYTALLFALSLSLSYLESLLPPLGPLPLKYGLANTPIILSIITHGLPLALSLSLFKSAFALATRGAMAALLSLAGGLVATLIMWGLEKSSRSQASLYLISALGALGHNSGQILVLLYLYGENMRGFFLGLYPFLLLLALASAWLTAALAQLILRNLPADF